MLNMEITKNLLRGSCVVSQKDEGEEGERNGGELLWLPLNSNANQPIAAHLEIDHGGHPNDR